MESATSGTQSAWAFRICVNMHTPQPPHVSVTFTKGEHTDSPSAINVMATRMKFWLTEGSHNTLHQKLPWTGSPTSYWSNQHMWVSSSQGHSGEHWIFWLGTCLSSRPGGGACGSTCWLLSFHTSKFTQLPCPPQNPSTACSSWSLPLSFCMVAFQLTGPETPMPQIVENNKE